MAVIIIIIVDIVVIVVIAKDIVLIIIIIGISCVQCYQTKANKRLSWHEGSDHTVRSG